LADDKDSESDGTQLWGRVAGQLSTSSLLPATMLLANTAVLLEFHVHRSYNIALAARDLGGESFATVIVVTFIVVATVVTIGESWIARLLEGYLSTGRLTQSLIAARIRRHENKRQKLERQYQRTRQTAFMQARAKMLLYPAYDQALLDTLEAAIFGRDMSSISPENIRRAYEIDWGPHAPAGTVYRLDSIAARLESYPRGNRMMPTRLGNVLRAAEDKIALEPGETVEDFAYGYHHGELPPSLRGDLKRYRARLDMYCNLVLVFSVLISISIVCLIDISPYWPIPLWSQCTEYWLIGRTKRQ
jgi:hypothetical protein